MAEKGNGSDQVVKQQEMCKPCKIKTISTVAGVYCKQCEEFQCTECSQGHTIYGFMKSHELVDAAHAEPQKVVVDLKNIDECEEHKRRYEYVCVDEDRLCCTTCVIEQHRACKTTTLTDQAEVNKIQASVVQCFLSEVETFANHQVEFLQEVDTASVGSELESLLGQLEEAKQTVIKKVEDMKSHVKDYVGKSKETKDTDLKRRLTTTKNMLERVATFKSVLTSVTEHGPKEQEFIVALMVKTLTENYPAVQREQTANINIPHFSLNRQELSNILKSFDSVTLLQEEKKHVDASTPAIIEPLKSVTVGKCETDKDTPLYTGMDFLPDGRLVVADSNNDKLYTMNTHLDILGKYSGPAFDVAVVSDNEVAITIKRKCSIELLHISKSDVFTLTRTLKTTVPYDLICMMNETTFLVQPEENPCMLRMITLNGEETDIGNVIEHYNHSKGMAYIRNRDTLVLTDEQSDVVYMGDRTGKCFITRDVKDEAIKSPLGVCVGQKGNVFVCSHINDSLVQLSPSGKVLCSRKLLKAINPRTLCISKDDRTLAVFSCNLLISELHLYKLTWPLSFDIEGQCSSKCAA